MSKGDENHESRFTAACVQFDVERGLVEQNLHAAQRGIMAATSAGAQLIVLPEMWTTSFVEEITDDLVKEAEDAEEQMLRLSSDLDLVIVGSSLESVGISTSTAPWSWITDRYSVPIARCICSLPTRRASRSRRGRSRWS